MPKRNAPPLQGEMLQGTLDMLVLRTLQLGPAHGHTIAHAIERGSEDVLQVEHGSLYPALHRLWHCGWIAAFWGTSENKKVILGGFASWRAKNRRTEFLSQSRQAAKLPEG